MRGLGRTISYSEREASTQPGAPSAREIRAEGEGERARPRARARAKGGRGRGRGRREGENEGENEGEGEGEAKWPRLSRRVRTHQGNDLPNRQPCAIAEYVAHVVPRVILTGVVW